MKLYALQIIHLLFYLLAFWTSFKGSSIKDSPKWRVCRIQSESVLAAVSASCQGWHC